MCGYRKIPDDLNHAGTARSATYCAAPGTFGPHNLHETDRVPSRARKPFLPPTMPAAFACSTSRISLRRRSLAFWLPPAASQADRSEAQRRARRQNSRCLCDAGWIDLYQRLERWAACARIRRLSELAFCCREPPESKGHRQPQQGGSRRKTQNPAVRAASTEMPSARPDMFAAIPVAQRPRRSRSFAPLRARPPQGCARSRRKDARCGARSRAMRGQIQRLPQPETTIPASDPIGTVTMNRRSRRRPIPHRCGSTSLPPRSGRLRPSW